MNRTTMRPDTVRVADLAPRMPASVVAVTCAVAAIAIAGCKNDPPADEPDPVIEQPELGPGEACDPTVVPVDPVPAETGGETPPPICSDGLACDPLADGSGYVCGAAVEIRGRVSDALDGHYIEGALVAALNEIGEPVTDVAVTDSCGGYALPVRVRRAADGSYAEELKWTLSVTARDYQPFPAGLRPALPVDLADAVPDPDGAETTGGSSGTATAGDTGDIDYVIEVIENGATSVALLPLGDGAQGAAVSGAVVGEFVAGTLVVAEGGPVPSPYAIADASGSYTIFNVPPGMMTIRGYRGGIEVEPATAMVAATDLVDVDLAVVNADPGALGTVDGSLNIVNAQGGTTTSVVLTPVSVYNELLERGPVPLGLRDPPAPMSPNVSSAFTIPAVPTGTYKVLVAFENDLLVRDPDAGIAGTAIQEVTVELGQAVEVPESFKVTEALAVFGPGTDGPEVVDAMPTLSWADDSSEDGYDLLVFDALGEVAWMTELPGTSGSDNVETAYGGTALVPGMYYQFRVTSWREQPSGRLYISRTEDLRGVFVHGEAPPPPACDPEPADTTGTGAATGTSTSG